MRVLTFTALFPNAAENALGIFNLQKMTHFNDRPGNLVVVVAPLPFSPGWLGARWKKISSIPRLERIGNLTVYHPRYFLLPKVSLCFHGLLMCMGSYLLVRRLHKQEGFHCIDAHYVYPDSFAAIIMGKLLDLPVIVSAHGTDINLFATYRTILPMVRWTLKNAAGCLAVSKALLAKMVELGAVAETSLEIGNGVDTNRFYPVSRMEARSALSLREEMLSKDAQMIICVAALIPLKGHRYLISAVRDVAQRYPNLQVYFLGTGSERASLEQHARTCGIADRINFAGQRPYDELPLWYSAANVSCLLSSREGWPNVLLESLACGTPVVATGVGAVPEIIVSGEIGIIVRQDTDDIARGLSQALDHRWDQEVILRYSRSRTWETVAQELEVALHRLSGKHLTKNNSH
jgi:teichuronic acid biosynthesis glycosyltransferase TuaC